MDLHSAFSRNRNRNGKQQALGPGKVSFSTNLGLRSSIGRSMLLLVVVEAANGSGDLSADGSKISIRGSILACHNYQHNDKHGDNHNSRIAVDNDHVVDQMIMIITSSW